MSLTAYFQCLSGISGDMCLGALIDAGADFFALQNQLSLIPLHNYSLSHKKTYKNEILATKVLIEHDEKHPHRNLTDINNLICASGLSESIKTKSLKIFHKLAAAEAKIHGTSLEKVHFHEVGAVDAIIDIVGTVICLDLLQINKVIASPLPFGHGHTHCAHGIIPLPAPAVTELLKETPVYGVDIAGELVTPTGAAIITTLAQSFGPPPAMTLSKIGMGAGTKDFKIPNILRIFLGTTSSIPEKETIEVIETTIDDMNPELFSYLWDKIFSFGAYEMFLCPVQMKKGRPGTLVTILCPHEKFDQIANLLLRETTSLGIRSHQEKRICAARDMALVSTKYGDLKVKIGNFNDGRNIAPEYEDCRRLAEKLQIPLKEIYAEAIAAARRNLPEDS